MNPKRYLVSIRLLCMTVAAAFVMPLLHAQSGTGSISGTVMNKRTSQYLAGVQVRLDGSLVDSISSSEGKFNLLSVSPGTHEVEVDYIGLNTDKKTVNVTAGETVKLNFILDNDVYKMESVAVSGLREGIALAAQTQRQEIGIKGVISTDMFPAQNSGNLGEFLKNTSGLYIDYSGSDARSVRLRGVPAAMNLVTQDGLNLVIDAPTQRGCPAH